MIKAENMHKKNRIIKILKKQNKEYLKKQDNKNLKENKKRKVME